MRIRLRLRQPGRVESHPLLGKAGVSPAGLRPNSESVVATATPSRKAARRLTEQFPPPARPNTLRLVVAELRAGRDGLPENHLAGRHMDDADLLAGGLGDALLRSDGAVAGRRLLETGTGDPPAGDGIAAFDAKFEGAHGDTARCMSGSTPTYEDMFRGVRWL
jgi:hypothetical protein